MAQYVRCIGARTLESPNGGCAITRHFLQDDHGLEDFSFTFIDSIPPSLRIRQAVWPAMRKRLESFWINRLQASMNIQRNWRISFSGGRTRRRPLATS